MTLLPPTARPATTAAGTPAEHAALAVLAPHRYTVGFTAVQVAGGGVIIAADTNPAPNRAQTAAVATFETQLSALLEVAGWRSTAVMQPTRALFDAAAETTEPGTPNAAAGACVHCGYPLHYDHTGRAFADNRHVFRCPKASDADNARPHRPAPQARP